MDDAIFIIGNFPSFKNSKQMTRAGFLIMSKTVRKYLKEYECLWKEQSVIDCFHKSLIGKEKPYRIGFHFVRGTKHKYDFINMIQGCQDLMVKHLWIDDDNVDEMIPFPLEIDGKYSSYSKDTPGVYIQVL